MPAVERRCEQPAREQPVSEQPVSEQPVSSPRASGREQPAREWPRAAREWPCSWMNDRSARNPFFPNRPIDRQVAAGLRESSGSSCESPTWPGRV